MKLASPDILSCSYPSLGGLGQVQEVLELSLGHKCWLPPWALATALSEHLGPT